MIKDKLRIKFETPEEVIPRGRRRLKPEEAPSPRFSRRGAGAALKKTGESEILE